MKKMLSLNEIYSMLSSLSYENKKWLADKLITDLSAGQEKPTSIVYPHISKDRPISSEVKDMVIGSLPEDFDVEREREKMWEDRAL